MLRYRAVQLKEGKTSSIRRQLTETDRNGKLGCSASKLVNWTSSTANSLTRPLIQGVMGIDKNAVLPKFNSKLLSKRNDPLAINADAPAYGRKAVIYSTCTSEYNTADLGLAAAEVLAKNGVETQFVYPGCCGMPQLEHGDIGRVANAAKKIAAEMVGWIDKGYDVISPVASCSLMLKFEWPLIEPEDENVKKLSCATFDVSEYLIDISTNEGIAPGLKPIDGGITLHIACSPHS